jgi:predicted nucleic acid-binding protein
MELADTSAWTTKHRDRRVESEFNVRVLRGDIATCGLVNLQLLFTTQDAAELALRREDLHALTTVPTAADAWHRAGYVMELLAQRGPLHHRQVPVTDLVIAASAELAGLSVLHYDRHFELIAEVTGQPVRAIAPLGSL